VTPYSDDEGDAEIIKGFHEFNKDMTGNTLRYRVLVRDRTIKRILYNTG
jgi:hypothetical protein